MVSINRAILYFVCLSPSARRWERSGPVWSSYKGRIEQLNLKFANLRSPVWAQPESDERDFEELKENLIEEIIDRAGVDAATTSKLEKLDEREKQELLRGLLSKIKEREKVFTVGSLLAAKDTVNSLSLPEKRPLEIVDELFEHETEESSVVKYLLLQEVLQKEKTEFRERMKRINWLNWNREKEKTLEEAKINALKSEVERHIEKQLMDHSKIHPDIWDITFTDEEVEELKRKFLEIYKSAPEKMRFKKADMLSLVARLYKLIWRFDFIQNESKVNVQDKVLELFKFDKKVLEDTIRQVKEHKTARIRDVEIPEKIGDQKEVHRLHVFREMLYEQFAFAKRIYNEWEQNRKYIIEQIKKLGFDVSKYERIPKPVIELRAVRPYMNFRPTCPEQPSLVENQSEPEEEDLPELEDEEVIEENLEQMSKELKVFSHMTPDELNEFFMNKVEAEIRFARRAKRRRELIRKYGNPFNTKEVMPQMEEEMDKREKQILKKRDIVVRSDITEEEVKEILSRIQTEYYHHLFNIEHLQWQVESAEILPIETLNEIYEAGESILKPEPLILSFKSSKSYEEYMRELGFKEIKDTEANRYRKHLYEISGVQCEVKQDEVREGRVFPNDPVFKVKDLELMKRMDREGAVFKVGELLPFMEMPQKPTEHQKKSVFYRMTISQPHPIYRCTKCDYRIFAEPQTAYDGRKIAPTEYLTFKKKEYKCWNCGADKEDFVETWPTGERGYKLPEPLKELEND